MKLSGKKENLHQPPPISRKLKERHNLLWYCLLAAIACFFIIAAPAEAMYCHPELPPGQLSLVLQDDSLSQKRFIHPEAEFGEQQRIINNPDRPEVIH